MKYLIYFFCAALMAAFTGAAGQTTLHALETDLFTFMNSDHDYIENQKEFYAKTEGSQYLDDAFQSGSVSFNRKKYTGLQLRYNLYKSYFEFQTDQGIKFFDPRVTPIDTVWMGKDTFYYVHYTKGKSLKRDYMKLMNQGPTHVLQLSEVILIEPEPAKGYQDARPGRFKYKDNGIFISSENQPATEFKGKKSLEEIFPTHHKALTDYAKKEKLSLKKIGEIVSLCAYYDTIR